MQALSLDELDQEGAAFDAAAAASPGIDQFCSSTAWGLPAHEAFMPVRRPRVFRGAHGYLALMESWSDGGARLWLPLEVVWALGCPLVGTRGAALGAEAGGFLRAAEDWDVLVVSGLAVDSPAARPLVEALGRGCVVGQLGEPARRCLVDLSDGVEGYLARRSRNFRRSVVRARTAAARAGVTFDTVPMDGPRAAAAFDRLLAVERRSWKGRAGDGLAAPEMEAFYRGIVARLAGTGGLRLTFARHEDRDVGFILGALFAGTYRGLQFSYDDDRADLGIGNALQLHTMEQAHAEGIALYDLGSDVEYKRRWCDRLFETMTLTIRR